MAMLARGCPWSHSNSIPSCNYFRHCSTSSSRRQFAQPTSLVPNQGQQASASKQHLSDRDVATIQLQNKQLRAQLAEMRWPRLNSFVSQGREYALPVASMEQRVPTFDQASVQYLAGFFDGDGNVSCSQLHPKLRVTQSCDSAQILLVLRHTFGGGIYNSCHGQGLRRPSLHWQLHGTAVSTAARLLARHSVTKRRQLEIVANWPREKSHRQGLAMELERLKYYDSSVESDCSWRYLSGFFDAEGCIQVRPDKCISLQISQKFPNVLVCINSFLSQEFGSNAGTIHWSGAGVFRLFLGQKLHCMRTLRSMLGAGILCKKKQVELALELTSWNASHIREELAQLSGNQSFGRGLDPCGLERAREIGLARRRLRYWQTAGNLQEANVQQELYLELKATHARLNALVENARLRLYMEKIGLLHPNTGVDSVNPGHDDHATKAVFL